MMAARADDLDFSPRVEEALAFFRAQPRYAPAPLLELEGPGGALTFAKDERERMGLGAFKALGAPYAVSRIVDRAWRERHGAPPADGMRDPAYGAFAAAQRFVCASAGNHGLGVAAGAAAIGARARIHLAESVPASFARRLEALGAEVVRSGAVYDESVAAASEDAARDGWTLLADGTWPGYVEIPKWVMEGYCVIAEELREAFARRGAWPSRVYLQAGVGGLAAAMAHMIRSNWAEQPELIVVEPDRAACLRASHRAGEPRRADGPPSIMGRLDCKEPSIVAWRVLERCGVSYATVSDEESARAVEELAARGVATTPSGAAGWAALAQRPCGSERPLIALTEGVGA